MMSLSSGLNQSIPEKVDGENLLIATWNIRSFGNLSRKWNSTGSPSRDLRGLLAIAEILKRFDVIAIQELVGNLRALREMMAYLGDDWGFLMTDVTLGNAGNNERLAFIYDTRRIKPSGLACELVIPPDWLSEISQTALQEQFARTPYAVSFKAGDQTFILVTLHVDYGSSSSGRIPELKAIARWMKSWANRSNRWEHNLIALGDFNIDRKGDDLWKAFTSTGLTVPKELNEAPRSIFSNHQSPTTQKYYDQIAWFTSGKKVKLTMNYKDSGFFDFVPHVYKDKKFTKNRLSYRISDHYPLWCEFLI